MDSWQCVGSSGVSSNCGRRRTARSRSTSPGAQTRRRARSRAAAVAKDPADGSAKFQQRSPENWNQRTAGVNEEWVGTVPRLGCKAIADAAVCVRVQTNLSGEGTLTIHKETLQ